MKDSNENHIFINEKLNKALKKSEDRIEKLTQKIKTITNESVVLPKTSLHASALGAAGQSQKVIVEKGPGEAENPNNMKMPPVMSSAAAPGFG